jgi:hypothetical protein
MVLKKRQKTLDDGRRRHCFVLCWYSISYFVFTIQTADGDHDNSENAVADSKSDSHVDEHVDSLAGIVTFLRMSWSEVEQQEQSLCEQCNEKLRHFAFSDNKEQTEKTKKIINYSRPR